MIPISIPVAHLPPRLLVPHHVYNLPVQLVVAVGQGRRIYDNIAAPFDPHRGAEFGLELGEDSLSVAELGRVEVLSFGLCDAREEVVGRELIGRRNGAVDGGENAALWSRHLEECGGSACRRRRGIIAQRGPMVLVAFFLVERGADGPNLATRGKNGRCRARQLGPLSRANLALLRCKRKAVLPLPARTRPARDLSFLLPHFADTLLDSKGISNGYTTVQRV